MRKLFSWLSKPITFFKSVTFNDIVSFVNSVTISNDLTIVDDLTVGDVNLEMGEPSLVVKKSTFKISLRNPSGVSAIGDTNYDMSGCGITIDSPNGKININALKVIFNNLKSSINISNPPTSAELTAEFGSIGDAEGFMTLVDDSGSNANVYLVFSNGSSWWHTPLTKAV